MAPGGFGISSAGDDRRARVSQPGTAGKVLAGVVMMEAVGVVGVNRHRQDVTDGPARKGYVAVAPVL